MPAVRPIDGNYFPLPSPLLSSGIGSEPPADFLPAATAPPNPYAPPPVWTPEWKSPPIDQPLTAQEQLWQINVLGQTGSRNEHMGILVIFGQYAAKACTLAAAMPAVWLSPDYVSLTEHKRLLRDGGYFAGGVNLLSIYAFPLPSTPIPAAPPPAAGAQLDLFI